jgi:hypothetical protein
MPFLRIARIKDGFSIRICRYEFFGETSRRHIGNCLLERQQGTLAVAKCFNFFSVWASNAFINREACDGSFMNSHMCIKDTTPNSNSSRAALMAYRIVSFAEDISGIEINLQVIPVRGNPRNRAVRVRHGARNPTTCPPPLST